MNPAAVPITFKAIGVPSSFQDREGLRRWLEEVARDHGHRIRELNYVLMTDDALLEYNKRFLDHDEFTDVITFDGQTGTGVSGDVLISYDRIRENAANFQVSIRSELERVMVHGLLHLLGHTDKTAAQKKTMRSLEDHYLALRQKRKGRRP